MSYYLGRGEEVKQEDCRTPSCLALFVEFQALKGTRLVWISLVEIAAHIMSKRVDCERKYSLPFVLMWLSRAAKAEAIGQSVGETFQPLNELKARALKDPDTPGRALSRLVFVSSCLCLVLSCLFLSCLVLSCPVLSLSCLCLVFVLSLSCLVLSCLVSVLSCLVLSFLVLSCLVFVLS